MFEQPAEVETIDALPPQDEHDASRVNRTDILTGLFFGTIAALLTGIGWAVVCIMTELLISKLAIIIGVAIGFGVFFGSGNRKSIIMALLGLALAVLAHGISDYFVARHFIIQDLAAMGYEMSDTPLFLPLQEMFEVVVEFIEAQDDGWLYWIFSLIGAFVIPLFGTDWAQRRRRF